MHPTGNPVIHVLIAWGTQVVLWTCAGGVITGKNEKYRMFKEWDRKHQTLNVNSYEMLLELQFHIT